MILKRNGFFAKGIFGELLNEDGSLFCFTLEHAYLTDSGYQPKVPSGEYMCVKGTHQLSHSPEFETFEIIGVKDHTGILFHWGNFNHDSNGCVLLGMEREGNTAIAYSRKAFNKFMISLQGVTSFTLTVI